MPNGKPGDHLISDIVRHRMDLLGDRLDDKVRRIDPILSLEFREVLAALLYKWPRDEKGLISTHGLAFVLDSLLRCAEKQRP